MKIMTILGSPRKQGKTAQVLGLLAKNLTDAGHSVSSVTITDHAVNGCLGCGCCKKEQLTTGCIQKDGASDLFEQVMASDIVVYSSPLYAYDISAQLKPFYDRHFCLLKGTYPDTSSLIRGKRVALLITCSGPVEGNADLVQEAFQRTFTGNLQCNVKGTYIIPNSFSPDFTERAGRAALEIAQGISV